jgi:hypothetical protein
MTREWRWDPVSCLGSKARRGIPMRRGQKAHEDEDSSTTGSMSRVFETQVRVRRKTTMTKKMKEMSTMNQRVVVAVASMFDPQAKQGWEIQAQPGGRVGSIGVESNIVGRVEDMTVERMKGPPMWAKTRLGEIVVMKRVKHNQQETYSVDTGQKIGGGVEE